MQIDSNCFKRAGPWFFLLTRNNPFYFSPVMLIHAPARLFCASFEFYSFNYFDIFLALINIYYTPNCTGDDNSNKRCLSGSVCKIKSSRKFERPSRFFSVTFPENFLQSSLSFAKLYLHVYLRLYSPGKFLINCETF